MASINQFLGFIFFALFLVSQAISRPLDASTTTSGSLAMRERHEQWMARHGRVYKSVAEKEKRFHIFESNMKNIEKFNSEGVNKSYTLGVNGFSDLTSEEFLSTHTGFVGDQLPTYSGSSRSIFSSENLADAQNSVDWRQKNVVTPVKDQGSCGCCWAFSTVAALEGIYAIKTGNLESFSEQNLVDCSQNGGCGGGYTTTAYDYMKSQGIDSEEDYPYEGIVGQCNADQNSPVTISGYQQVSPGDANSLMAAVNQQPVSVTIYASDVFQSYTGGIYNGDCNQRANHAVTVIGYGTDDNGMNYWLVKNSWGQSWGENGYMRILMDENVCPITKLATFPVM